MKLYTLVHTENSNYRSGADVESFLSLGDAQKKMQEQYETSCKEAGQDAPDFKPGDDCYHEIEDARAVVQDGIDTYSWQIVEQDLPVEVALVIEMGMVVNTYATGKGICTTIYDRDSNTRNQEEEDQLEKDIAAIKADPHWFEI